MQHIFEQGLAVSKSQCFGVLDENLQFQSLTDREMEQESLQALQDYEDSGHAIEHEKVTEWVNSIGTKNPLSCPK